MVEMKTGWERDRRTHFDEIASSYDRARWDYPHALYADIAAYQGPGAGKAALEIGAGTGKATAPMLAAGYTITAVELGENMAEYLQAKFQAPDRLSVIIAAFEDATLPDNSYDIIYAASAFHWIDAGTGCPKVRRLLKSDGTFALFRNNPGPVYGDGMHGDIQALYEKHYLSVYQKSILPTQKDSAALSRPDEIRRGFGFADMGQYGFTDIMMKFYPVTHTYDADGYIALLDTYADHRGLPESNRAALYAGIRETIVRHGGLCYQDCLFQLYMGRRR